MFSLPNKRRLMQKSVNLNKYGQIFIIFPLPVMLKFTVHITAVHLFTCVAKAVASVCICSILESGSITEQKLSRGVCADDLVARNRVLETIHSV